MLTVSPACCFWHHLVLGQPPDRHECALLIARSKLCFVLGSLLLLAPCSGSLSQLHPGVQPAIRSRQVVHMLGLVAAVSSNPMSHIRQRCTCVLPCLSCWLARGRCPCIAIAPWQPCPAVQRPTSQPAPSCVLMASRLFQTPPKHPKPAPPITTGDTKSRQMLLHDYVMGSALSRTEPAPRRRMYRKRGTCGTYLGHRPPKGLVRHTTFVLARDKHQKETKKKRMATHKQHAWREFLKRMLPMESEGSSRDRMRRVAAKWAAAQPPSLRDPA